VILDAWSRRVVGYAISRSIDVRLALAALNAAIERRKPPPGCVHHTDRGSQYAAQGYREALLRYSLVGSMGRRVVGCGDCKEFSFAGFGDAGVDYVANCATRGVGPLSRTIVRLRI